MEWVGTYFYKGDYLGWAAVKAFTLIAAREAVRAIALQHFALKGDPGNVALTATPVCLPGDSVNYRYWSRENEKLDPLLRAMREEEDRKERELYAMIRARYKCWT